MIKAGDVMFFLCPQGGWVTRGQEYEGIEWSDGKPLISKEEFEAGWIAYQAKMETDKTQAAAQKQALLNRLSITAEEAKLLFS